MNPNISFACIFLVVIVNAMVITQTEADGGVDRHCPDMIRDMLRDGCRHLQRILKEQRQKNLESRKKKQEQQMVKDRTKRDIDNSTEDLNETENETIANDNDDGHFTVQFLENESHETFMRGNLYNGRRSIYPEGAHLILNHRGAKLLRQLGSKYKIEPRPTVTRGVHGKLIQDHTNRHRRYSEHHHTFVEKMAACCQSETSCLVGFCLAG